MPEGGQEGVSKNPTQTPTIPPPTTTTPTQTTTSPTLTTDTSSTSVSPQYNWVTVRTKRPGSPLHRLSAKRRDQDASIPTHNNFELLSDDSPDPEDELMQEEVTTENSIPPLVFEPLDNIDAFVNEITTVIGSSFTHTTQKNGKIRVMCTSAGNYRELVRYCRSHNYPFNTYQPKNERSFRCVIEGLHNSTSTSYVKTQMEKYGHTVRNIICARHRIEKYPIDLFFVDLEPASNNKSVYDVIYIGNNKVKIVPPRASPLGWKPQCYRCQELGHTKTYCNRPWVCVKCARNHPTDTCTKPKEVPPKCYFCGGDHPSNYRGCTELKKRNGTGQAPQQPRQQPYNHQQQDFPAFGKERPTPFTPLNNNTNQQTYARTLSQSADNRVVEVMMRMEQLISKQMEMMSTLINMVTLFMSQCRN